MNKFTGLLAGSITALALLSSTPAVAGDLVTQAQIQAAQTAEQHEVIARSYDEEAVSAEKKAESHANMAKIYRNAYGKDSRASMAAHCSQIEQDFRNAAGEYRKLAAEHRQMAASAN